MSDDSARRTGGGAAFSRQVGDKERRRLAALNSPARSAWAGLGMAGMIGWSVAIPALLGVALGLWLDEHHHGRHSWTLMLLAVGLVLGCANAWHWVMREK